MMNNSILMVDIGARYGLHPTWKNYGGDIEFHLIEADPKEAKRLAERYKCFSNVFTHNLMLAEYNGKQKLNILKNPAMSSTVSRKNISPLFWEERNEQLEVMESIIINSTTLNNFREKLNKCIRYIKIDTEGTEYSILKNYNYFSEVYGIRSEVCFDNLFGSETGETFSQINLMLLNHGFMLLNIDYDGQGDFYSKLISHKQRYGILQSTDAVWIKKTKRDN
ncbi:FkbM family methyltransferase [Alphaproteobacteria bacterium]|nr:FkbM family methyltransferase [Alphaproteobacteria bacterium]